MPVNQHKKSAILLRDSVLKSSHLIVYQRSKMAFVVQPLDKKELVALAFSLQRQYERCYLLTAPLNFIEVFRLLIVS
jgi:hypothetical protein